MNDVLSLNLQYFLILFPKQRLIFFFLENYQWVIFGSNILILSPNLMGWADSGAMDKTTKRSMIK